MRRDVRFLSRGLQCRGWLYVPDSLGPGERAPAIVMAHGFSAVKEMFLPAFAEQFAAAGFVTLVFDFRFLGESEGEPRGQVFPHEQHEDYRNAISWIARQPEVDPERIGAWGTSYSGGHVLYLSAFDRRIRAAAVQVPAIGAWRQALATGEKERLQGVLTLLAEARSRRFESGAIDMLKVVAPPGEPCVLAAPDAWEWFQQRGQEIAATWRNAVTTESVELMLEYDPAGPIELVSPTPLLMVVAERDSLIPVHAARAAFDRAGEPKELLALDCRHFDVYATEPWFSRASGAARAWFEKHLGSA